jgi:LuxR family maltose regulon positive regulatory protein
LLDTKLNSPVLREVVERPRLVAALGASGERLKLVRAPAGWGKSTLVAAWAKSDPDGREFAWLALDGGDNDPERFWSYAIEALRRLDPTIGAGSLPLLNAPGTGIEEHVVPALLNELGELGHPAVLVIDDYHLITSVDIDRQVALFIDRLPAGVEVVLASRSEPGLPLARWRAGGELLEIDADGLRFAEGDAEGLLNEVLDLGLGRDQVARLCDRTEGWVAGLYLAGLSLRGNADPASFVDRFAGDDRNVVDYLSAEVLAAQPERIRTALVRASILDRFCAPLLEAVTGLDDGAALLAEIDRADLFLVELDSKREWYRFHHLFQHLLRLELSSREPDLVGELHRRAAAWHLGAANLPEAIEHTIGAGDRAEAAELIAQHWAATLLQQAGDSVIGAWLDALGDDAVAADFRLCFARCFVELSYGDMDAVARWLEIAARAPVPGQTFEGLSSKQGGLACVRAAYLWESGDVGNSLKAGKEVLEHEGEDSPWRAIGAACIGLAHGAMGDWPEGSRWMREYSRLGARFAMHLNESSGIGSAAAFEAELGNWDEADRLATRALEIAAAFGMYEHWMTSEAHLAKGMVARERGEPAEAERELARAAEVARRGAGPVITAHALFHLTLLCFAAGERERARAELEEAERLVGAAPDPGPALPPRLAEARHRLDSARRELVAGDPLTERELDVLRLLDSDLSQREIGDRLHVSLNTVKTHTRGIFRKLEAADRSDAVVRAHELDLL